MRREDVGLHSPAVLDHKLEPVQGTINFDPTDAIVTAAEANHLQVRGLIFGSPQWAASSGHAFAMDHIDDWKGYANALTTHYKGRIRYWEIWNEGSGSFKVSTQPF